MGLPSDLFPPLIAHKEISDFSAILISHCRNNVIINARILKCERMDDLFLNDINTNFHENPSVVSEVVHTHTHKYIQIQSNNDTFFRRLRKGR